MAKGGVKENFILSLIKTVRQTIFRTIVIGIGADFTADAFCVGGRDFF